MAGAVKKIKVFATQGWNIYAVIQRETDSYIMKESDGVFYDPTTSISDYFVDLTEDASTSPIGGMYIKDESGTVWDNGTYNIFVYRRLSGSPVIATDTPLGSVKVQIFSDVFVEQSGDLFGGTLTESYAGDNTPATAPQLLYMLWSALAQFAISGTTITCKKLDGTTTAMSLTMDSATAPTLRNRTA